MEDQRIVNGLLMEDQRIRNWKIRGLSIEHEWIMVVKQCHKPPHDWEWFIHGALGDG